MIIFGWFIACTYVIGTFAVAVSDKIDAGSKVGTMFSKISVVFLLIWFMYH